MGRAHARRAPRDRRATLEAIAYEARDVVESMSSESGPVPVLKADGGASANDLLMRLQADQLGTAVERPAVQETTALGAAFLAGLVAGVWGSQAELRKTWHLERRFEPVERDDAAYQRWRAAVRLATAAAHDS
ncbi:FGGY-family carbohydrate kinase [[Actinomadura] parvosata]|uniref:FGGY-family carbohydrate kinase n=1 Tax=[Actinomadura] parvosata TaxID=1955412 RepID=UPI00406D26AE